MYLLNYFRPTMRPSQVDPNLMTKEPIVTPDPNNPGTYLSHMKVTGKTPGVHKACLQIGETTITERYRFF